MLEVNSYHSYLTSLKELNSNFKNVTDYLRKNETPVFSHILGFNDELKLANKLNFT